MAGTAVTFGLAYGVDRTDACRALRHAAIVAMDEALMDVAAAARNHAASPPVASARFLPHRYDDRYDIEFVKQWAVALTVVCFKLAHEHRLPLACVAEELALNAMIERANARADHHGWARPAFEGLWLALGDAAFLALFEDGDVAPALRFEQWFAGADHGSDGVLHPFYPAAGAD